MITAAALFLLVLTQGGVPRAMRLATFDSSESQATNVNMCNSVATILTADSIAKGLSSRYFCVRGQES